jgi:hypothetical protein
MARSFRPRAFLGLGGGSFDPADPLNARYLTAAYNALAPYGGASSRTDPAVVLEAQRLWQVDQDAAAQRERELAAQQAWQAIQAPAQTVVQRTTGPSPAPAPTSASSPAQPPPAPSPPPTYQAPATPSPAPGGGGSVSIDSIRDLLNLPQPNYGDPTGAASAPPPIASSPASTSLPPSQGPSAASSPPSGLPALLAALGQPVDVLGFQVPRAVVGAGVVAALVWAWKRWRRGR